MSTTMLAGQLDLATRDFAVEEVPIPEPGPGEVRVRVKAAGVCLSDVHLIDGSISPSFAQPEILDAGRLTLGHEVAGEIDVVGDGVIGTWAPGTRVVVESGKTCGRCTGCVRRRPCEQGLTLGVDYHGGWAEYLVVPEESVIAIPASLPFEQAAIIPDAVSTPYSAIVESGRVRPGQSVGIWGIGGLGAHAVAIARMVGAVPVIAVDPSPAARDRAMAYGADAALDPTDPSFVDRIGELTGGRGLEVAFDVAGHPAVRSQAVPLLAPGADLVLVGLTPEAITIDDSVLFTFLGRGVRGHLPGHADAVSELIALVGGGRLDLAPSVTARMPLADAATAVKHLEHKIGDPIRIVLEP